MLKVNVHFQGLPKKKKNCEGIKTFGLTLMLSLLISCLLLPLAFDDDSCRVGNITIDRVNGSVVKRVHILR